MPNDYKHDLTERLVESLEYLNRRLHRARLDEWETLDMSLAQIKTLLLLESGEAVRMGSIAAFLGRALSATTSVVDRLVARGLVVRATDANDRRAVVCHLTEAGQEEAARFWRIGHERLEPVADTLEVEQLQALVQVVETICDVTREHGRRGARPPTG